MVHFFLFFFLSIFFSNGSLLFSTTMEEIDHQHDDELVIDLTGTVTLHPTALLVRPLSEKEELGTDHIKKCIQLLKFDIAANGMMNLIDLEKDKKKENALSKKRVEEILKDMKAISISYCIICSFHGKNLIIELISIGDKVSRSYSPIPLTGVFASDRQKIHQLADSIFQDLFETQGIATTRLLYSKRFTTRNSHEAKRSDVSTIAEIHLCDYDGGNEKQLTSFKNVSVTPQWIPRKRGDKPFFIFVSYIIGQPKIYISSLQDKKVIRMSPMRGNQLTPAVSPDGKKIAFCSDILGSSDLYMLSFDPTLGELSKPRQIYKTPFCATGCPTWSPDGVSIAFVSNKDGSPKIYTMAIPKESMKLKDLHPKLITKKCRENSPPAWSPDGKKIAYSAKTGQNSRQIWIYDIEHDTEYQITSTPGNKENPSWAPNSLHIAYQGMDAQGKWDIYIIDLHQKKPMKITEGPGDNQFPAWELKTNSIITT